MHVSRRHPAPAGQRHQPPERPGGAALPEHQVPPQDGQQGGGQEGQHPVQAHGLQQPHGRFTLLARKTFFMFCFSIPDSSRELLCNYLSKRKSFPANKRQRVWPSVHKKKRSRPLCSCEQALFSSLHPVLEIHCENSMKGHFHFVFCFFVFLPFYLGKKGKCRGQFDRKL